MAGAESVVVRQDSAFEIDIRATDPEQPNNPKLFAVKDVLFLSPYGMMLASLASCTAIVLHTFAQNHGVHLHEVEVRALYERSFPEDCKHCEEEGNFAEDIKQGITLRGHLTPLDRKKLLKAADYCPIHKILSPGIKIITYLEEDKGAVPSGKADPISGGARSQMPQGKAR